MQFFSAFPCGGVSLEANLQFAAAKILPHSGIAK